MSGCVSSIVCVCSINNKKSIKDVLPQFERSFPILDGDKSRYRAIQNYELQSYRLSRHRNFLVFHKQFPAPDMASVNVASGSYVALTV